MPVCLLNIVFSILVTTLSCISPYEIIHLDIDAVSESFQYTAIETSNMQVQCWNILRSMWHCFYINIFNLIK